MSATCLGGKGRAASNENGPFSTDEHADNDDRAASIDFPPATRMASTLFRRQLARTPRLSSPNVSSGPSSLLSAVAARRHLSRSAVAQAEPAVSPGTTRGGKNVFETHTVEDLHGMHASEILAETGTRPETQLRHFTGE